MSREQFTRFILLNSSEEIYAVHLDSFCAFTSIDRKVLTFWASDQQKVILSILEARRMQYFCCFITTVQKYYIVLHGLHHSTHTAGINVVFWDSHPRDQHFRRPSDISS